MTLATEDIWFVYMDKNSPVNCVTKISQHLMESIYIKEKSMALCIKGWIISEKFIGSKNIPNHYL